MKKYYFVTVCFIILIFLLGFVFRLGTALKEQNKKNETIINIEKEDNKLDNNEENNIDILKTYSLVSKEIDNKTISKPLFNNEILDNYIDSYIILNNCNTFNFGINYLTKDIVNLKLECTNSNDDKIYDLKESKFLEFKELIKNEELFKNKIYNLLYLKYPKFVVNEVDILNSKYIINDNKIKLTYETLNYGNVSLVINNNEIKDMLKYEMKYDKTYENEEYKLDPNKKTIAFTFDDGPSEYDLEIINALVESHSNATFFIVGSRINNYQRSILSMINNNMEVGNHSYDHKSLQKITNEDILYQINETNNIYKNLTGKEIRLLRPPYGAFKENIYDVIDAPIILWNIDTLDWQVRNTDKVYNNILKDLKDGDIILMHSLFETTKDAVIKILPELYKQGYQIVSVSELAKLKGINIENDTVYRSFK